MPGTAVSRKREASVEKWQDARLEALAGEDESYDEYVPLRERRRREAERRAGKLGKNRRDKERELLERERWAGPWARKRIINDGRIVVLPSHISHYFAHLLDCNFWYVPDAYLVYVRNSPLLPPHCKCSSTTSVAAALLLLSHECGCT